MKENSHNWNAYFKDNPISQIPLVDLTPKDFIRVFQQWTKDRQLTRKKLNNIKSLINGIYYYAIEEGIVTHNPVKDISSRNFTFKAVNHSDDVFTLDERKKLLSHLAGNDDMYSLAIQLDFQLVARIGELLSLRWSDIGAFYRCYEYALPPACNAHNRYRRNNDFGTILTYSVSYIHAHTNPTIQKIEKTLN